MTSVLFAGTTMLFIAAKLPGPSTVQMSPSVAQPSAGVARHALNASSVVGIQLLYIVMTVSTATPALECQIRTVASVSVGLRRVTGSPGTGVSNADVVQADGRFAVASWPRSHFVLDVLPMSGMVNAGASHPL